MSRKRPSRVTHTPISVELSTDDVSRTTWFHTNKSRQAPTANTCVGPLTDIPAVEERMSNLFKTYSKWNTPGRLRPVEPLETPLSARMALKKMKVDGLQGKVSAGMLKI